jgi:hypothetical protein
MAAAPNLETDSSGSHAAGAGTPIPTGPVQDDEEMEKTRLIAAAPRLRDALAALVEWQSRMGGWDASFWREAETLLAEVAGVQVPLGER